MNLPECKTRSVSKQGLNRFEFSFPFSRLVAMPTLKNPFCLNIYQKLEEEYFADISQGYSCNAKC